MNILLYRWYAGTMPVNVTNKLDSTQIDAVIAKIIERKDLHSSLLTATVDGVRDIYYRLPSIIHFTDRKVKRAVTPLIELYYERLRQANLEGEIVLSVVGSRGQIYKHAIDIITAHDKVDYLHRTWELFKGASVVSFGERQARYLLSKTYSKYSMPYSYDIKLLRFTARRWDYYAGREILTTGVCGKLAFQCAMRTPRN